MEENADAGFSCAGALFMNICWAIRKVNTGLLWNKHFFSDRMSLDFHLVHPSLSSLLANSQGLEEDHVMSCMHNSTPVIHVLFPLTLCLCHIFLFSLIPPLFVRSPFFKCFGAHLLSVFASFFCGFITNPKQLSHSLSPKAKFTFG